MSEADKNPDGWVLHVTGTDGHPSGDKIMWIRESAPRILLEIDAPGVRSLHRAGQTDFVHQRLRDALDTLRESLPLLPGSRTP